MKISNEEIIQSARRQRQEVEGRMSVEPWQAPHRSSGLVATLGIAASLASFFAGYALHATMPQQTTAPLEAQVVHVHDTIMQMQTVRDTIYRTRIVTKHERPLLAESDPTPPEQQACSMLCDDIPYELLAAGR